MTDRAPKMDLALCKKRRQAVQEKIGNGVMVLPAHPHYIRNNDVHHAYRQDSNVYYLSGFEEPESVLVLVGGAKPKTILFVLPKDLEKETWDGFRYGAKGAKAQFGVDEAYVISDFEKELSIILRETESLYYKMFFDSEFDRRIEKILSEVKAFKGRSGLGLLPVIDPAVVLGEMRVIKSEEEIEAMKLACQISSEAHNQLMKYIKPGMNERELHGKFMFEIMKRGAEREGYGSIFASGDNANTLHYTFNDCACQDGDLILIDAGAEKSYYTGDITRTFPVNGKFSAAQKEVYQGVLDIQKTIVSMVSPGVSMAELQQKTSEMLVTLLLKLGILDGEKENLLATAEYRTYYMHGIGHYLGMDVHDAGLSKVNNEPRRLEAGMCITIEPGVYIRKDAMNVPAKYRGIGIRIEDNILVTDQGFVNMTEAAVKEVSAIESLMGS